MSIPNINEYIKRSGFDRKRDIVVLSILVFAVLGAFFLGRLSMLSREPVLIQHGTAAIVQGTSSNAPSVLPETEPSLSTRESGEVVASKSGTKYHFPWCAGARSIKEENKIWFDSIETARTAGYFPAGNCKGLQ